MLVPRQEYSRELKVACMRELDSGKGVAEVARRYQISPKRLENWKGEWRAKGEPAIPWQVALQQSLPPLRRPRPILQNPIPPYNDFPANGDNPLNSVSQPKGSLHWILLCHLGPHPPGFPLLRYHQVR